MSRSVTEILEYVFSTPNPTTGTLPPEHVAWVVFAHGTVFYSGPSVALPVDSTFDAIATAARAALEELGPPLPGTEAADFNPGRLDAWFPDEPVWLVGYGRDDVVTIVTMDAAPLAVGLSARARRELDLAEQSIISVRGFDGVSQRRDT